MQSKLIICCVFLLQTAFRVLQQHPQVLGSRIGMMGLSLGASFTLKMAVYSEVIKVKFMIFMRLHLFKDPLLDRKTVLWLVICQRNQKIFTFTAGQCCEFSCQSWTPFKWSNLSLKCNCYNFDVSLCGVSAQFYAKSSQFIYRAHLKTTKLDQSALERNTTK